MLSIVMVVFIAFMALDGLMAYRAGTKSREVIPATLMMLFIATLLPLTLHWHRVNEKIN